MRFEVNCLNINGSDDYVLNLYGNLRPSDSFLEGSFGLFQLSTVSSPVGLLNLLVPSWLNLVGSGFFFVVVLSVAVAMKLRNPRDGVAESQTWHENIHQQARYNVPPPPDPERVGRSKLSLKAYS